MLTRFETLTGQISGIYKNITRIKRLEMEKIGLKSIHCMPLYYLYAQGEEGLTGRELCELCREDKAGISRILADFEAHQMIVYRENGDRKRYRSRAVLTEKGRILAEQTTLRILNAIRFGGEDITDADREVFYRILSMIDRNLENLLETLTRSESSNHKESL